MHNATRLTGTGAALLAAAWPSPDRPPVIVDERRAPDIVWVGRLAVAAKDNASPPKPLYLRAPDAQPQAAARLPRR
jgi:tRNA A37 threonylcarbamoyladenosine modification protein TsaB